MGTITQVGTLGIAADLGNNAASLALTTATNPLLVGDTGLLTVVCENLSTAADGDNGEVTGVTGGTGTWSKVLEWGNTRGAANAGCVVSVWAFVPAATLPTGTGLTIGFNGARREKCAAFWGFRSSAGLPLTRLDAPAVANSTTGATNYGSASFAGLPAAQRLYFRALGKRINSSVNVTGSAGFSAVQGVRSSNNAAAERCAAEFRINTSTGETSDPTLAVLGNTAAVFLALSELSPTAVVNRRTLGNRVGSRTLRG